MSWNLSHTTGKAPAVAAKATAELAKYKCSEPEETIKGKAAEVIAAALAAFPADAVVTVEAHGSQGADATKPGTAVNQVFINIVPVYGYVE